MADQQLHAASPEPFSFTAIDTHAFLDMCDEMCFGDDLDQLLRTNSATTCDDALAPSGPLSSSAATSAAQPGTMDEVEDYTYTSASRQQPLFRSSDAANDVPDSDMWADLHAASTCPPTPSDTNNTHQSPTITQSFDSLDSYLDQKPSPPRSLPLPRAFAPPAAAPKPDPDASPSPPLGASPSPPAPASASPPPSPPRPASPPLPSDPKLRLKISRRKARERKKGMMEQMQASVEGLSGQLAALTMENERLRSRNAILESIVKYLEEYMLLKAVKSHQQVPPMLPGAQQLDAMAAVAQPQQQLAREQQQGAAGALEEQAARMQVVAASMPASTVSRLLSQDFKALTPEKVIAAWNMYIAEASVWVMQAEAQTPPAIPSGPPGDVLARISALNIEFLAFVKGLAAENLEALQGAQILNLQSAALPISEDQHWRNVAASLDLTPQQCTHIYVARDLFLAASNKYSAERSSLSSLLQEAIQSLSSMALTPSDSAAVAAGDRVVAQMRSNLKRQSITYLAFSFFVIERIFTPLQFAKMFVHSHPFFASPLTLMNIITGCAEPQSAAANAPPPPPAPSCPSPLTLLSFLAAPTSMPHPFTYPAHPAQPSAPAQPPPPPSAGYMGQPGLPQPGAPPLFAPPGGVSPTDMGSLNFFPDLPASWAPASGFRV